MVAQPRGRRLSPGCRSGKRGGWLTYGAPTLPAVEHDAESDAAALPPRLRQESLAEADRNRRGRGSRSAPGSDPGCRLPAVRATGWRERTTLWCSEARACRRSWNLWRGSFAHRSRDVSCVSVGNSCTVGSRPTAMAHVNGLQSAGRLEMTPTTGVAPSVWRSRGRWEVSWAGDVKTRQNPACGTMIPS